MIFSQNQVRQMYVGNALSATDLTSADAAGTVAVKADTAKKLLWFEFMGASGIIGSDKIKVENIISAKATDADALARPLSRYKVVLDSTVNGGAPLAGQDYLLRVNLRNYLGLSEENTYMKHGMVHAVTGMTASTFYKTLGMSLVKNFNREDSTAVNIYLETGGTDPKVEATAVPINIDTDEATLTGTYTGVIVEEASQIQDWDADRFPLYSISLQIQPDQITVASEKLIWGTVTKVTEKNKVDDGYKISELEHFTMGNRGDLYRKIGWPNSIDTKYLVDATKKYNVIDIHYYFVGPNHDIQKSEKDITIVVPKIGGKNSVSNVLANSVITAINTATGLTIPLLSVVDA
jgi:hypothetical protein